jgi:hypothetical protein
MRLQAWLRIATRRIILISWWRQRWCSRHKAPQQILIGWNCSPSGGKVKRLTITWKWYNDPVAEPGCDDAPGHLRTTVRYSNAAVRFLLQWSLRSSLTPRAKAGVAWGLSPPLQWPSQPDHEQFLRETCMKDASHKEISVNIWIKWWCPGQQLCAHLEWSVQLHKVEGVGWHRYRRRDGQTSWHHRR